MAVDCCPPGVKTLSKNESDGQVSWSSYTVEARIEDTNWCYRRKVVLHEPQRQFAKWSLDDINNMLVDGEVSTFACCHPDPRSEEGNLERGDTGTKTPTQVFRGNGEPKQI